MKSKRFLILVLWTIAAVFIVTGNASTLSSSGPVLQWERFWGGSKTEEGKGIYISEKHIYVSGSTDIPDLEGTFTVLLKYDLSGSEIWSKIWGGYHYDRATRLYILDNNIYVAAWTHSYADDPVGDLEADAVILEYNPSGNLQRCMSWGNYPGYSGSDGFNDVFAVDKDIYAVGSSEFSWGNPVSLLQKYNVAGNLMWTRFWGPRGRQNMHTYALGIAISGNEIYVVGATEITKGNLDGFILKYDSEGNLIWEKTWGGSKHEACCGVATLGTYIYVVGYTNSFGAGGYDVVLLKYDSEGNLIWEKTWGGSKNEAGRDIFISDNCLYVVGNTKSFGVGEHDALILKIDLSGNPIWYETWGGAYCDVGRSLFVLGKDIYVVGDTESFGAGERDIFLLRYTEKKAHHNLP
ncbi:MAG TPA: hypothetical protein EYP21_09795 [Syntrophaceae bacterium]|nr:hypothetical protein [Syntrophaceae bacterium]